MSDFREIWKFQILDVVCGIEMPKGARVLHVQEQNNEPFIWALVDPDAEMEERRFHLIATGQQISADWLKEGASYLGTVHLKHDPRGLSYLNLVFHVFEWVPMRTIAPS